MPRGTAGENEAMDRVTLVEPETAPGLAQGPPATVLIADDEDAVRRLVGNILRMCGYHVLETGSGEEALRTHDEHAGPIHLLLTDLMMPGMNGCELADALRERRPGLPVLFMSGYAGEAARLLAPSSPLIHKPFAPTTLAERVREMLEA